MSIKRSSKSSIRLSDTALRAAIANMAIEGYEFLDENGNKMSPEQRLKRVRELIEKREKPDN